jgi:hypothetical protein
MLNRTSGRSGSAGTSGTNGTSGTSASTSGTSGVSRTSGTNGTNGTSGRNGTQGTSGRSNTSGTSGTAASSGASPGSGSSGTNGTAGTSGISGNVGTSGTYVSINAGSGLSGGGVLNTDRTISIDTAGLGAQGIIYWDGAKLVETSLIANSATDLDGGGVVNIQNIDNFTANSKSFDILHPTKGEPWRLRYGVLEGPEHGVYFRGQTTEKIIELPYYWIGLVHANSYTVQLTPIGKGCVHYVTKIEDNKVYIDCECGDINAFFTINAERKDVDKVLLEYKTTNK